jgi:hypothetical protein
MVMSELSLVMVTMDWQAGTATFYRSDNKTATVDIKTTKSAPSSRIKRMHWALQRNRMFVETTLGDAIEFEMPAQIGDQLDGRLVVYLDQNVWSLVAQALHDPQWAGRPADRAGALRLARLVQESKIVLPLSSGHYTETTKWSDDQSRYRLALTTLQLSRGWQMRDPFAMRRQELSAALRSHAGIPVVPVPPVFTLDAYAASRDMEPSQVSAEFTPGQASMLQALTYATVMIDVMLDADQIPPTTATIGWATANQAFSDWLDSEVARPGPRKRKSVDVLLLQDISREIAEEATAAGLTVSQMSAWIRGPMFRDMAAMPALGLYRELLQQRHLNVGTVWRPNDLTDMIYLSSAAGYADIVVAERHMTAIIRQGLHRQRRPRNIYRSLQEAIPAIEAQIEGGTTLSS